MNKIIALIIGTGLTFNIFNGENIERKNVQLPAPRIVIATAKADKAEENKNSETKEIEYIKFEKKDLVSNIYVESREKAIDLVAEEYELDHGQLTAGKMNNNVYLVNFFDDVEETTIVNLYLVVNGEIIDQKYVEGEELSSTFVDNFMKYQEVDPIVEYLGKIINENKGINEELVAQAIANLISFNTGCDLEDIKIRKAEDGEFVADFNKNGEEKTRIYKDGDFIEKTEQTIAGV